MVVCFVWLVLLFVFVFGFVLLFILCGLCFCIFSYTGLVFFFDFLFFP